MEGLALILFYLTLIGTIASIGLIIYSAVKKKFKYKPKQLAIILGIFIVAFIGSTIFYGSVQSPESKAKFEASQKAKEEEKAQKELAEKEEKENEEKQKQEDQKVKENSKDTVETVQKEESPVVAEVPKADDRFIIKSEPNTSAAVDEIYYKAKEKAATATEDDLKEAIKFISNNYNNYWVDNETMHKTMYYGSLLECAKKDKAKENQKGIDYAIYSLGEDTVQVVKYVYRKVEKVEDSSTQSNLRQIKKSLDKISDDYKK
ncbi:hypothetical protein [Clostridium beijerinckii]|uniref:Cytoskeletal protein RodZ n=1 Tax=Clostridium beijerinckii TaxID=1520 RepID=A0AAX0B2P7_CLOBE|nr:hypothetical protein [Clostridium beijerinckii]NRT88719.1 cytoskeletal protein RodZ [Clostridium beijerinckii]NYC74174.1 cytoskeletal protein RodZ [Clostridium beijerinckii]